MNQVFFVRGLVIILLLLIIAFLGSSNRWCQIKKTAYSYKLNEQLVHGNINQVQFHQAQNELDVQLNCES